VNTFSPEDAAAAYEKYAVPETGQILYEAGFANFHLHPPTELHFKMGDRAPLLIVGAEKDHTVPAAVSHKQYEKYEKSEAQTDYVEYPGRPHLMMVAEGWEEIAAGIEGWLEGVLAAETETGSTMSASHKRGMPRTSSPSSPGRYWSELRPHGVRRRPKSSSLRTSLRQATRQARRNEG
jgi:hypothetical protein